jgi:putative heme-binding domain-containing protein
LRTRALATLVQAQHIKAAPTVIKALAEAPEQKSSILSALGGSTQGCQLLIHLVDTKQIQATDISLPIAQRIFHIAAKNPTAQAINQQAEDKKKANVNNAMARIPALEEVSNSNSGNHIVGQSLFAGMCLSCHVVGDQGAGVGPALDGSSERDTEGLLTAMLNPDAAAESAYILFRTIESSGLITEGLKARQDQRGTSIAHQGGMITYVPKRTIREEHHAGSTSFMPTGLIDSMPDETIAHLLAYIKTLK